MYFVNLVLQFFSRKIFLDYLGTKILGLNTTATNLLQFLNRPPYYCALTSSRSYRHRKPTKEPSQKPIWRY